MDCIFCEIINGQLPCKKAFENEQVIAFYDIKPQAPIHILIMPKEHIASTNEITAQNSAAIAAVYEAIPQIAASLGISSYRVINNCGVDAGQTVSHVHFHLLAGKVFDITF